MLGSAKVAVEWKNVPDLDEIAKAQREIAEEKLLTVKEAGDKEEHIAWAEDLLSRVNAKDLVARLLWALSSKKSAGYDLTGDLERELRRKSRSTRDKDRPGTPQAKPRGDKRPRGTMLRLNKGLSDGWDVGRVLQALCTSLNVDRSEIGVIRVKDDHVMVELLPVALSRFEADSRGLEKRGLLEEGGGRASLFSQGQRSHQGRDRFQDSGRPRRKGKRDQG